MLSLIDKGVIPCLVHISNSYNNDLAEQALWGIGNVAGDNTSYRDQLIDYGAINSLLNLYNRITKKNFDIMKVLAWVLSNLCRGKPLPKLEKVRNAIPVFS